MKKKILSAIMIAVLALGTAMSLVGCSGTKLTNTYLAEEDPVATYTTLAKIDKLEDASYVYSAGDLYLFSKLDTDTGVKTYMVYNLKTGAIVSEFTNSEGTTYSVSVCNLGVKNDKYVDYFTVQKTVVGDDETTITNTLYSKAGASIDSVEDDYIYSNSDVDIVIVDDACYRVDEDSNITLAFEQGLADIPVNSFEYESEDYYYFIADGVIYVYDKQGSPVSSYQIPTYADQPEMYVLENGNILLQYLVYVDTMSDDYDAFMLMGAGGVTMQIKVNLETKIINPKNAKAKDIDLDVVIDNVISGDELIDAGLNPDLKNVLYGCELVDKQLNEDEKMYKLSNSGKVSLIEDVIPNMYDVWYYNGHYFVENELEQVFLYTAKGKLVGEISNYMYYTDKFIVTEKAIYDYTLTKVYDLKANDLEAVGALKSNVVVSNDDGDKLIFSGSSTLNKITAEDTTAVFDYKEDCYYTVKTTDEGATYTLYNADSTALGTFEDAISFVGASRNAAQRLIQSGTSFYRVA